MQQCLPPLFVRPPLLLASMAAHDFIAHDRVGACEAETRDVTLRALDSDAAAMAAMGRYLHARAEMVSMARTRFFAVEAWRRARKRARDAKIAAVRAVMSTIALLNGAQLQLLGVGKLGDTEDEEGGGDGEALRRSVGEMLVRTADARALGALVSSAAADILAMDVPMERLNRAMDSAWRAASHANDAFVRERGALEGAVALEKATVQALIQGAA